MKRNIKLSSILLPIAMLMVISSCSLAPGMRGIGDESTIKLPNADAPPANVKVREITADLIVQIDKENADQIAYNRKTQSTSGMISYAYRLGVGDVVNITVWDHPELTTPAGSFRSAEASGSTVDSDGTIFYPYAGVIKVKGLTIQEVRHLLTTKLDGFIENLMLDVKVIKYRSQRIYIVGQVKKPGIHVINDLAPTVLEMINRAGGFSEFADRQNITVSRNEKTYRIDMQALYELGNSRTNVLLKSGDVVNIWDNKLNKVFVMGEVNRPSSIQMENQRKSLAEAITDAGGINQKTSNVGKIFVVRSYKRKSEIFHLDASTVDAMILAERFPLRPRDVVYVSASALIKWNRIIMAIAPTIAILDTVGAVNYPLFGSGSK